mmetsp:Transcript_120401/g.374893  ORF Transcript_120401/g.374893 Transcript_120401/m.374893 type:complete len:272 (-) Transcript_120401:698-1513(-)
MQDVERLRPAHPSPAAHHGTFVVAQVHAGEVRQGKFVALQLHTVEMVHGVHTPEGRRLLHVEVVGRELSAAHFDARGHHLAGERLHIPVGVQVEVRVHEVRQLPLHGVLRCLDEARLVEGHLRRAQLLGHEPVDLPDLAVHALREGLEQKSPVEALVGGLHLQLQHVDHAHEQRHAVITAPELELRLLLLDLLEEVLDGAQAVRAPLLEIQVELAEPEAEGFRVWERALGLALLEGAPLEEVSPDLGPLQPDPGMHVLELPVPLLVRIVVL